MLELRAFQVCKPNGSKRRRDLLDSSICFVDDWRRQDVHPDFPVSSKSEERRVEKVNGTETNKFNFDSMYRWLRVNSSRGKNPGFFPRDTVRLGYCTQ